MGGSFRAPTRSMCRMLGWKPTGPPQLPDLPMPCYILPDFVRCSYQEAPPLSPTLHAVGQVQPPPRRAASRVCGKLKGLGLTFGALRGLIELELKALRADRGFWGQVHVMGLFEAWSGSKRPLSFVMGAVLAAGHSERYPSASPHPPNHRDINLHAPNPKSGTQPAVWSLSR